MQFDQTTIRVRERGSFESLDLALHVLRRWWGWLPGTFLVVAVPLAVLNGLLLEWIFSDVEWIDLDELESFGVMARYGFDMLLLVWLEAPLAATLTTLVLGNLVFDPQPRLRKALRGARWPILRLWLHHLVFRGIVVAVLLVWSARVRNQSYTVEEFLLVVLALLVALVRVSRPYLPEILLLEKVAWRRPKGGGTDLRHRVTSLHTPFSGEVVGRSILTFVISVPLCITLLGLVLFASQSLFFTGPISPVIMRIGWPIALWSVVLFTAVSRFVNYLDLRVRSEGWEIELQLRAEAERLLAEVG